MPHATCHVSGHADLWHDAPRLGSGGVREHKRPDTSRGEHAIDSANLKFGYSQWSVCFLAFSLGAAAPPCAHAHTRTHQATSLISHPVARPAGASHYLCSPSSEGSRLKAASTAPRPPRFPGCLLSPSQAVTMAATGHMHKVSKLLFRLCVGEALGAAAWAHATAPRAARSRTRPRRVPRRCRI